MASNLRGGELKVARQAGGKRRYHEACANALSLLMRADARHTQAMLMALPAWKDASCWQEGDSLDAARGMLHAIQQTPGVRLPSPWLVESARLMAENGHHGVAHAFIRLLERNADADGLIEQLCAEDTPLPLRAAAWSCKLGRLGLPRFDSVKNDVEAVLYSDGEGHPQFTTAYHAAQTGCLLARVYPESLCYENGPAFDSAKSQAALKDIGALLSAELCGAGPASGVSAELAALRERHGIKVAASLELEYALSRYIWEHRERFLQLKEDRESPCVGAR